MNCHCWKKGSEHCAPVFEKSLKFLESQGLRLYIASNGGEDYVKGVAEATEIRSYFKKLFCGRVSYIQKRRVAEKNSNTKRDPHIAKFGGSKIGCRRGESKRFVTQSGVTLDSRVRENWKMPILSFANVCKYLIVIILRNQIKHFIM